MSTPESVESPRSPELGRPVSGRLAPDPLYTDPEHGAPTDPTLIAGPDGRWWMFYTQRRSADPGPGVRWVHGTDIGVAHSVDGGLSWHYGGVVAGLDPEPGRNTLWAPEVITDGARFHMFTSHIVGVPDRWAGHPRHILHHTSTDLINWEFRGRLPLSSDRVIDACVHPLPDGVGRQGGWRLWYKDEAHDSATWSVDSADLSTWSTPRPVITDRPHEGPNVFALGASYWMITDEWQGLGVYRSADLTDWSRVDRILDQEELGLGHHADIVVGTDTDGLEVGWVFYFTHRGPVGAPDHRRTDIRVATLRTNAGELRCDRQAQVALDLRRAVPFTVPK